jgi:flagellar motor protein MotB
MNKRNSLWLLCASSFAMSAAAQSLHELPVSESSERHLSSDQAFMQWVQDPKSLEKQDGDRIEVREFADQAPETVKLKDVVPPIRFPSGVAEIPDGYIERLRAVLDGMRDRKNVRLHLVGHADDQPLSPALAEIFGDNQGLSRERAGEVAEYFQNALALPPQSISYEWAGETRPIASNATEAGRALNRRVEVEVWYDELRDTTGREEVVVTQPVSRVKVCRIETVCKLTYMEGRARRARIQNLVPPLHYGAETIEVTETFVAQVSQALGNLSDKQNVVVKFIGYTDNVPLTGRTERIYGTHEGLSNARAIRTALALQEALELPAAAVQSEGRGTAKPLGSNETAQGRALNRRVEVELWYDDPLQELPDEPQLCPDAAGAETVTRVYDPPWGRVETLRLDHGQPVIPAGYTETLRRALGDVAGKTRARLRFVGYTTNETLDRRTALVYGDDIGLSAARARRAMETIRDAMQLDLTQAEYQGRGYVQSSDVVNAGFIQGEDSHVVVQVVYDELAVLDDYEGVDIARMTRELEPENPLGLNLLRITVDGEPIDDPERSSSDIQRCTDVALERADIQFGFDDLRSSPRLSVAAQPSTVLLHDAGEDGTVASPVLFRMYANYSHFIERAEIRIFERDQSTEAAPLETIAIGDDGFAEWQPLAQRYAAPAREVKYVLRAYGANGNFDETGTQPLWFVRDVPAVVVPPALPEPPPLAPEGPTGPVILPGYEGFIAPTQAELMRDAFDAETGATAVLAAAVTDDQAVDAVLDATAGEPARRIGTAPPRSTEPLAGYGETGLELQNIQLSSGTVTVRGSGIPPEHTVWIAGRPVPVDEEGRFVAEEILPTGAHTVEVAVLDAAGNGEVFLRDLELEPNDWFYVGMADVTLSQHDTSGPIELLQGENPVYPFDSSADARLAFYVNGKFNEHWKVTASADTRDGPIEDLFSNFVDKSPDALFRRIDPDYQYPTFGDDGSVEETAPTLGKLYVRVDHNDSYGLWGNFKVGYAENELTQVDRGLYGGQLHYQAESSTSFGAPRFAADGFTAEPGTIASREEFRGTGGSLYFLRVQDLLVGSERVRIELRDKASGIVTGVVNLRPSFDYDIDYLQGRILLSEPLNSTVDDDLLVRSDSLSGDEAYLVVRYEYTPGFEDLDAVSVGGQAHYWFGEHVKLGLTANSNEQGDSDSSLNGADLTVRMTSQSWVKLQTGASEGLVSTARFSDDGGFGFVGVDDSAFADADAGAQRVDVSVGLGDIFAGNKGRVALYDQTIDAGYSAPGLSMLTDAETYGGSFKMPVTERVSLNAKSDIRDQEQGLERRAKELDVGVKLTDHWDMSTGFREDFRRDNSAIVPLTQEQGERTDGVVQVGYDSGARWRAYSFLQDTLSVDGDREENGRVGVGGLVRVSDRIRIDAEVSNGDLGEGGKVGTNYAPTERTSLYMNYALEADAEDNGWLTSHRGTIGSLVAGVKTRFSDSTSVYLEERHRDTEVSTGLTHSTGVNFTPTQSMNFGVSTDIGTLRDTQTGAETRRKAGGVRVGYGFEAIQFTSGVEYRFDESEQLDLSLTERTSWLFRTSFKYQIKPEWRLVGKLNHSDSESSLGSFYDGGYTEAVLGYALRPVRHDRFEILAKHTYFYNVPTTEQVTLQNRAVEYVQKSHITAFDMDYDITPRWSVGGKYAYRRGEFSLDRVDPEFFDNTANLYVLRTDFKIKKEWEALVETRLLDLPDVQDHRSGSLITISRPINKYVKVGVGYNFTDFTDDLTDLSFDDRGAFVNVTGAL